MFDAETMEATRAELSLSPEEFLKRCTDQAAWVTRCMHVGDDTWTPHLTVWTKDGFEKPEQVQMMALHVPFNNDREQFEVLQGQGARLALETACPVCIVLISEAWHSDDPLYGRAQGPQPKDDPRRREVVLVQGVNVLPANYLRATAPLERLDGKLVQPLTFSEFTKPPHRLRLLDWFIGGYMQRVAKKIAARTN